MGLRYLDSVDTVRSHWGSAFPHLAKSEMILALLMGEKVRISQTQAFDSLQILDFAEDPDFRELIREGFIEILPFVISETDTPRSPMETFKDKLANPAFHFSAWLSIPAVTASDGAGKSPEHQRRLEIIEDAKKDKFPDPGTERMWANLARLETAYQDRQARLKSSGAVPALARPAAFSLRSRLQQCHEKAGSLPYLQEALGWLLQQANGNDRSVYHLAINRCDLKSEVKLSLHSVVNLAYNEVIAGSLQSTAALTTVHHDAEELLRSAGTGRSSLSTIEASDARLVKLQPVTWSSLAEWLPIIARCEPDRRPDKMLQAAEEIGLQVAADQSKRNLVFQLVSSSASAGVKEGGKELGAHLLSFVHPAAGLFAKILMRLVSGGASRAAKGVKGKVEKAQVSRMAKGEIREIYGLLARGFSNQEGRGA